MTGLLQPERRWKTVHGGWQTRMKRCPDCKTLLLPDDIFEHEDFHIWLDGLADQIAAGRHGPAAELEEGEGVARAPLADRVPVAFDWRRPRREPGRIARAFADAWLAVFPRRPLPELPPATIHQPPAIPAPTQERTP